MYDDMEINNNGVRVSFRKEEMAKKFSKKENLALKQWMKREQPSKNRLGKNARKLEARRDFVLAEDKMDTTEAGTEVVMTDIVMTEVVTEVVMTGVKMPRISLKRALRKPGHRRGLQY
jgi:hypothetical protein